MSLSPQNRFLVGMLALSAVAGAVDQVLAQPDGHSPLMLVYGLGFAMLLFGWCKAHAAARDQHPPAGTAILAAFLAPIGLPLYFFRSMRATQATWACAKAAGFFCGLNLVYLLGWEAWAWLWA